MNVITEYAEALVKFRDDRDSAQLHDAKILSIGIEARELLEAV